jgi:hypothetical protein
MFFSIDTKKRLIHKVVSSVHEIPLYTHEMTFVILFSHRPGDITLNCDMVTKKYYSCLVLVYISGLCRSRFRLKDGC